MNPTKLHKLAIGGPFNGDHVTHWQGDIVEHPQGNYRKATLSLNGEGVVIYISEDLTNQQALELLTTEYLGVPD